MRGKAQRKRITQSIYKTWWGIYNAEAAVLSQISEMATAHNGRMFWVRNFVFSPHHEEWGVPVTTNNQMEETDIHMNVPSCPDGIFLVSILHLSETARCLSIINLYVEKCLCKQHLSEYSQSLLWLIIASSQGKLYMWIWTKTRMLSICYSILLCTNNVLPSMG